MRRVLMAAAAAAAIGLASPASAAVTFQSYNGPDLTTQIKASATDSTNNAPYVYGSTDNNGQSADVFFEGFQQAPTYVAENIHITGTNNGSGYASITDSPNNDANNFYALIVDVTSSDFNQYMFSVQLVNDGTIHVYYLLSGGSWNYASLDPADPTAGIFQKADGNNTYLLQGGVFTAIMVMSTGSAIKEFKQQSITLGSVPAPLPEPGTWAMMLLGFGGIGLALRRGRRRSTPALMQVA
jgi:hypothetical protein